MTLQKRLFDIVCALVLIVVLSPLVVIVAAIIAIQDGLPIFYLSERMHSPDRGFKLWKFRTMTTVDRDDGVSGGDKSARITKTGKMLRRYRLDEVPQLWNILKGDISFVGPRPPLRKYVEQFPELYGEVLKSRPGVTGLATLAYHKTEERLLALCETARETDAVYSRRCVPRKATLDLIYAQNQTVCGDLKLMLATVFRKISLH